MNFLVFFLSSLSHFVGISGLVQCREEKMGSDWTEKPMERTEREGKEGQNADPERCALRLIDFDFVSVSGCGRRTFHCF
jgi:hypothetical protein